MAPKINNKNKSNVGQVQQKSEINRKIMVLVRDETSQIMSIVDYKHVSLVNKSAKIEVGTAITWQNSSKERFRGVVLALGSYKCNPIEWIIRIFLGTESECSSAMFIIENNITNQTIEANKSQRIPLQSSITIEENIDEQNSIDKKLDGVSGQSLDTDDEEEQERDTSSFTTNDESLVKSNSSGKRTLAQIDLNSNVNQKIKKPRGGVSVPFSVYSSKEKECLLLQERINVYEQIWMPRPSNPSVIQYFIEIANILAGNSNDGEQEDKDEMLEKIKLDLNMTENQLIMCHGPHYTNTSSHIEENEALADEIQMIETHDVEMTNAEEITNNDKVDVKSESSTDDENELDAEDFMVVDEMNTDESIANRLSSFQLSTDDAVGNKKPVTMKDIACLLILFKYRHRLSIQCISDLLKLLLLFGVDQAPRSWYQLKSLLMINDPTLSYIFPCSQCSGPSTDSKKCSCCGYQFSSTSCHDSFIISPIKDQLDIILRNNADIDFFSPFTNNTLRDIKDGNVYQQIKTVCTDPFLTLTMNIDGVEVRKGLKRSIWPILFVVNELPLKQRYALENVIIAGIWSGLKKPSRLQMKSIITPIVEELLLFEQGYAFTDYTKESLNQENVIKVFLTSACCDKPAQALVQNLPEPTGAFGCGRCELEGEILKLYHLLDNFLYKKYPYMTAYKVVLMELF
ncbi:unnamed protein product [Rotaria sp. Silwood2]|nr:unnamed protein product [Rotaria sp. Silwood2]